MDDVEILERVVVKNCPNCGEPIEVDIRFEDDGKFYRCREECSCQRKKREKQEKIDAYNQKMQKISDLKHASLMDKMFYDSTFANFRISKDNEKVFSLCQRYVAKFDKMYENNQGLLFYGDVGTGKSFSAACIANGLMSNLKTVIMTSFIKILQRLSKFENEETLMRLMIKPDLLIIDDLGAERSTDYALEKVYGIIDSRYREHKPVILTTNLTLEEMKACTDIRYVRIYDRVFEMCYPVKFKGVSQRKIAAKERFEITKKLLEED